jgi:hypothetical protein
LWDGGGNCDAGNLMSIAWIYRGVYIFQGIEEVDHTEHIQNASTLLDKE